MLNTKETIPFSAPVEHYLNQLSPKPGRRVIWNSYSNGTYIKSIHGPIGSSK